MYSVLGIDWTKSLAAPSGRGLPVISSRCLAPISLQHRDQGVIRVRIRNAAWLVAALVCRWRPRKPRCRRSSVEPLCRSLPRAARQERPAPRVAETSSRRTAFATGGSYGRGIAEQMYLSRCEFDHDHCERPDGAFEPRGLIADGQPICTSCSQAKPRRARRHLENGCQVLSHAEITILKFRARRSRESSGSDSGVLQPK